MPAEHPGQNVATPETTVEPVAKAIADSVNGLLETLDEAIGKYTPSAAAKSVSEEEQRILQLSAVAENALAQLWLLDRSGLDQKDQARIDAFPKRLADLAASFDAKHDRPLLGKIKSICNASPSKNKKRQVAPHQGNIDFYRDQIARASSAMRALRGTDAQEKARESLAGLSNKISAERREQFDEYQKFVANCCRLAYDAWDGMNAEPVGVGRIPKDGGFRDEGDFIDRYVRAFSEGIPLGDLCTQAGFDSICMGDGLISDALLRTSGDPAYLAVATPQKAFIVTAVCGLYRVDRPLLAPETARLFSDVFGRYYEKMDPDLRVLTVRWMSEEPKVRLEDF